MYSLLRNKSAGISILELMIVLALIGTLSTVLIGGVRRSTNSDIRHDASRIASALRMSYNLSSQTGNQHRVLFDLDNNTFQIQACHGQTRIPSEKIEAETDEQTDEQTKIKGCTEISYHDGNIDPRGTVQKLKETNYLKRIYIGYDKNAKENGLIAIHSFPLGSTQRSVVEISTKQDDTYALFVHRLTGRVDIEEYDAHQISAYMKSGYFSGR